ncbi:MAG: ATP-binding protein [Muribaculaceae bacterium]|nr:ATP-binding protein [Muribaculaceae bacterium]
MEEKRVRYPIGQQSFEVLRKGGFLYVDKTMYIDQIVNGSQYYFLGRPRRFGKSLFLSTLKAFFEGKRELFRGLHADTMDWDWEPYPVIYIDLNNQRYQDQEDYYDLNIVVDETLKTYEEKLGITAPEANLSARFALLIRRLSEAAGKGVVILVDEYDKPLVNNINDHERFVQYRNKLSALYSNFKSSAPYIRLVFLTGVSRFGKLSVFSGLNNISDISFIDEFAAICGITEDELKMNFRSGIASLAEKYGRTPEEEIVKLKHHYDGYHFSEVCPDIYNPFSLLQVMAYRKYSNYWIASANSSLLVEELQRVDADLMSLVHSRCAQSALEGLDIDGLSPMALLFQTGYLTIKDYDEEDEIYTLGIPNEEVREGFFEQLIPWYTSLTKDNTHVFIADLRKDLERGEVDKFMHRLQSLFAGFGHDLQFDEERNVQNAMFLIFSIIGIKADAEVRTSDGSIDILVRTSRYIYIMELKYNRSAGEALAQINEKEYALPWSFDARKIIKIGINYSSAKRRIDDWKIEEQDSSILLS